MAFHKISRRTLPLALLPVAGAILALVVFFWPTDPPPPPPRPTVTPARKSEPFTSGDKLVLQDGTTLQGEVLREGRTHVVMRYPDGRIRLVSKAKLKEQALGARRPGTPARLRLKNGRLLEGQLLQRTAHTVEFRLGTGTVVMFRVQDIASIESSRP